MKDRQINGMRLPANLVKAMDEGTWDATGLRWKDLFPVIEVVRPKLYSFTLMQQVNNKWQNESNPVFVGVDDGRATPGALDTRRSLLIGELQGDSMIALDYRDKEDIPSVVFLNLEGKWTKIAPTFDEFWHRLGEGA